MTPFAVLPLVLVLPSLRQIHNTMHGVACIQEHRNASFVNLTWVDSDSTLAFRQVRPTNQIVRKNCESKGTLFRTCLPPAPYTIRS